MYQVGHLNDIFSPVPGGADDLSGVDGEVDGRASPRRSIPGLRTGRGSSADRSNPGGPMMRGRSVILCLTIPFLVNDCSVLNGTELLSSVSSFSSFLP